MTSYGKALSEIKKATTVDRLSILSLLLLTGLLFQSSLALAAACVPGGNDLGGNVWRDFNANGIMEGTEPSFTEGTVTAYDDNGVIGTTTVSSDGTYYFADIFDGRTGDDAYIRLEFNGLPDWAQSGVQGDSSGTTVQRHSAATCAANLAVQNPAQYCQANPDLATTRMTGESYTGYETGDALITFESGSVSSPVQTFAPQTTADQFSHPTPMSTISTIATQAEAGNLYGIAWHRETQTLFSAAYGRANNMNNGGIGPSGLGAIYMTKNGTTSLFKTVPNVGTFGYADGNKVGKVGLGDLKTSEDGKTLYAVNAFTNELVMIPLNGTTPTAGTLTNVALPVPSDCPATNIHGFGLGQNNNKLYVGLTCDGIGSADLIGYVYEYDGVAFTQKIHLPFSYPRPNATANYYGYQNYTDYQANNLDFVDWGTYPDIWDTTTSGTSPNLVYKGAANNAKTQPWLADIAFDNGDMLIGVRNRLGDARLYSFWVTGGDVLRACADSATNPTTWTMENNGSCGGNSFTVPTTDPYTGRSLATGFDSPIYGIGGHAYYWGNIGYEGKPSNGEIVQIPGHDVLYGTGTDIQSHNNQFGIMALSHISGAITGGGHIAASYDESGPPWYDNGISKGNGLGDIEALCHAAPLEIGNYVWFDEDGDGIQDPSENGISGAEVTLDCGGTVKTTTTANDDPATAWNESGTYYFSGAVGGNAEGVLIPGATCTVAVDPGQAEFNGYTLTTPNSEGDTSNAPFSDLRDSDGLLITNNGIDNAQVTLTLGNAGENNHGLDFGFVEKKVDIELTKTVNPPITKRGDTVVYTLTVSNKSANNATGVQATDNLPAALQYVSDNGDVGEYTPGTGLWNIGIVAAGESKVLEITVIVK